jgi:hypothetical protein
MRVIGFPVHLQQLTTPIGAPQNRDLAQPRHHLVRDDAATVFRGHNQMVVECVNAMELFDEMRLTCHATKRIISP